MDGLSLLDFLMTLVSNRFNPRLFGVRRLGSMCNCFIRTAIMASTVRVIFGIVQQITYDPKQLAYNIMNFMEITAAIVLIIVFAIRRKRLRCLIAYLLRQQLPVSRSISLIAIFSVTLSVVVQIYVEAAINSQWITGFALFKEVAFIMPVMINNYGVVYPALYVTVLDLVTHYEMNFMRAQLLRLKQDGDIDARKVMTDRRHIMEMKAEFESLLNLVPFCQFAILFQSIPGVVVGVHTHIGQGSPYAVLEIIFFTVAHVSVFLFLYFIVSRVVKAKRDVNQLCSDLIHGLQDGRHDLFATRYQSLIEKLRADMGFQFTGWNMFTIDQSVWLSFLSSIITFSVLLIQLASSL